MRLRKFSAIAAAVLGFAAAALWIDQFHAWMKDRRILPVTKTAP